MSWRRLEDVLKTNKCLLGRLFDTSNYDKNDKRPLSIGKNKKVIGMFKDELGWKILKEFCATRAKTYAYLKDGDIEEKKAKGTKKCIIKQELRFGDYADSLFKNMITINYQKLPY